MGLWPADYEEYVLKDIEKYKDTRKIKKAGFIERCAVKTLNPHQMHPNPDDEFSQESVGPNFQIISKYMSQVKKFDPSYYVIYDDPIFVQKMDPDGYLILNGHHRWFAALRLGFKKLRVQIVNLVNDEDVNRMLQATTNTRIASFDLDEILLTDNPDDQARIIDDIFSRKITIRLRKGVPELFNALHEAGYDIWIYSADYNSEEYISTFFSMYCLTVDGIINGVTEKRRTNSSERAHFKELMAGKYTNSLHIDDLSVVSVDNANKDFQQYDIEGSDWAQGVIDIIKKL